MIIDPSTLDRGQRNALVNGLVAPRPIAWVSSLGPDNARNLAPFSFFGAFSFDPPTIGLGPGSRQGVNKDTLHNVKSTGELVVNLVDRRLAELANACSAEWGPEIDEWDVLGVEPAPTRVVAPMRVADAPAALECRVRQVIELGEAQRAGNSLIVAWIVCIHVRDDAIDGLTPLPAALDLVARLGGDEWCTTRDRFTLARPASDQPETLTTSAGSSR